MPGALPLPTPRRNAKEHLSLFNDFQKQYEKILNSGGIAAVGIAESKSLEIALSKTKMNGRRELAQMVETKIEALQKSFVEETGLAKDAELLSQFSCTVHVWNRLRRGAYFFPMPGKQILVTGPQIPPFGICIGRYVI